MKDKHNNPVDKARFFYEKGASLLWQNWAEGKPGQQDSHKKKEPIVTIKDVTAAYQEWKNCQDPVKKIGYRNLWTFFAMHLLENQTSSLSARVEKDEAAKVIHMHDGTKTSFRDLGQALVMEANPAKRRDLNQKLDQRRQELADGRLEILQKKYQWLKKHLSLSPAGFSGYFRGVDTEYLRTTAEYILDVTEELYKQNLRVTASLELNIGMDDLQWHDFFHLFKGNRFQGWFPADKVEEKFYYLLDCLGLREAWKNVRVDDEVREGKIPGAFMTAVHLPTDIRISINPVEGFYSYRALFHEGAHAIHTIYASNQPFQLVALGPQTVSEAFAFLFESVFENPNWCRDVIGMPGDIAKEFVKSRVFHLLFLVRKYCARMLFELNETGDLKKSREIYREFMERALCIRLRGSEDAQFLFDRDEFLYSANYLVGWILYVIILSRLSQGGKPTWYLEGESHKILKNLMQAGQSLSAHDVAEQMGYNSLVVLPLLQHIEKILSN